MDGRRQNSCSAERTRLTFEVGREFMQGSVFTGLDGRTAWFDSPLILHFSPADFGKVIDRCERLGVAIFGVEVFSSDAELLDIVISSEDGLQRIRNLTTCYAAWPDVTFCATFKVPDSMLESK
jgi:hypothetical protein